jgi:3-isopropylmalate/(R)-2-methylmalate dehydratase small subunit
MRPFVVHRGTAVPLLRRDVDTDQIIPKQFLKSIERTGFGRFLFHDWRTRSDGSLNPEFVLNDARFANASILIAGENFGCGSSREHAAWALEDYGIRAVIAPSFADIFRSNALTNGVVPVVVREEVVLTLADRASRVDQYSLEIDLMVCRVRDQESVDEEFQIDAAARHRLLNGLDDIALILQHESAIDRYETARGLTPQRSGFSR